MKSRFPLKRPKLGGNVQATLEVARLRNPVMADRAQMRLNVSLPRENTFETGGSAEVATSYRQRKNSQVKSM